ncbi:Outer membrane protein TolC [Desulfocicer vacuolatum DSM 3385]|uniref:Outer membrane protein TolC n=1 Tax=Desulfocicer vacuolatum DSM 3385 TaxID=1121400 RepID=A0A1W2DS46_9BACT|nr:TolC family protein [Desulfocicer vacuolatum]SMD00314.1 Outer membrane protein TolC [Desulfocicer vacuolatum DSM 3385]
MKLPENKNKMDAMQIREQTVTRNLMTMMILCASLIFATLSNASEPEHPERLNLDLETVMTTALEHNHALKASRMEPLKEKKNIQVAKSIFDPEVSIEGRSTNQESWNEPTDKSSLQFSTKASISRLLETGTVVSLGLEAADNDAETDINKNTGGSYVQSTATISHPLMKNSGQKVVTRNITLAKNNHRKSKIELKQEVIDTLSQAQRLYWSYYSALESLTVYEKSLELARRLIKEVKERVKMGSAARLDILQARSEVATRETDIIIAQNNVLNSKDALLNYIYGETCPHATLNCLTLPAIPGMDKEKFNEKKLIDLALALRTDYQTTAINLESADTDLVYFENQTKPELNLSAAIAINDAHPDKNALETDNYQNYYSGSLGVTLKFPWGLKGDKANYAAAKLNKKQLQISRDAVKSRIILDVRTALRDLEAAIKGYETAQTASRYAEEALDAEQVKFRNGLSTSYNVLLYQRDFTDARNLEINALIACQTALISLHQAVGNTLEKHHINLKSTAMLP